MNTAEASGQSPEAHPTRRSGGLFIALVGVGIVRGVVFAGRNVFNVWFLIAGFALAMLSQFFSRRWSPNRPTRSQAFALIGSIILEMGLFIAFINLYPTMLDDNPAHWWLIAFILVGIHFLPMSLAHGRPVAILGILCIALASAGLIVPALPFAIVALLDGLLKIGVGGWMFVKR